MKEITERPEAKCSGCGKEIPDILSCYGLFTVMSECTINALCKDCTRVMNRFMIFLKPDKKK